MIDAALAERQKLAWDVAMKIGKRLDSCAPIWAQDVADLILPALAVCANEALENVFNLTPGKPNEHDSAQYREGYYAGLEAYRQAIRALKAEG